MNRLLKGVCTSILYINGNNRLTRVTKSAVLKNSLILQICTNKSSLTSHVHNYLHDDRLTGKLVRDRSRKKYEKPNCRYNIDYKSAVNLFNFKCMEKLIMFRIPSKVSSADKCSSGFFFNGCTVPYYFFVFHVQSSN